MLRIVSIVAAILNGLWLLQGLGIVQMQPILCFANCVPVQGPSTTWALIGGGVMAVGCIAMLGFEHGDHVWVGHEDEVMTEIGKLVKRDAKLDEP